MNGLRTWIEIDASALRHNAEQFFTLIPERTRFMAVIKSNAYGHGLVDVANVLLSRELRSASRELPCWFGVDSVVEALRLRKESIKNPILVLGATLPSRLAEAAAGSVTLTVASFESLRAFAALEHRPEFHIKLDTGMHRQGFLETDIPELLRRLRHASLKPSGIYTHFADAKDPGDTAYTLEQFRRFSAARTAFTEAGYADVVRHAAATGGTLIMPDACLDMVRIGIGLYGCWPSEEIAKHFHHSTAVAPRPALTWKTVVTEVKTVPKGARVGYDGTETVGRDTTMAVLPIGYWHGYDRGLSGTGEVLIQGRRAKVLGRISMDMTVVDVTDISGVRPGAEAVLIGRAGADTIPAEELAGRIGTTAYEILTRINPLIQRTVLKHVEKPPFLLQS